MIVDAPAVARLLRESRSAHLRYREALQRNDPEAAHAAMQTAYAKRLEADDLDRRHTAEAWAGDTVAHDDLVAFFQQQLSR